MKDYKFSQSLSLALLGMMKLFSSIEHPEHTFLHLFETISDGKLLLSGTSFLFSEERSHTFRCFKSRKQS